jgi:hypothetical protein
LREFWADAYLQTDAVIARYWTFDSIHDYYLKDRIRTSLILIRSSIIIAPNHHEEW